MQKNDSGKIKLGVFVTIGMALFIAGIYYIGKKQQLFNKTFRVGAVFKDINGLQVGNNVRLSGINVGVVENIEMVADTIVKVDCDIDEDIRKFIRKNSHATISSDGLMGNKIVVIIPGNDSSGVIQSKDLLLTTAPPNMDNIMLKLGKTADNMANLTQDLSVIIDNIRSGKGTIGKLFMDTNFANNINQTIVNLKQGAGGFKKNMDAASHSFLLRGAVKKQEKEEQKAKDAKKDK